MTHTMLLFGNMSQSPLQSRSDSLERTWRALSDPTRRRLLDMLRIAPSTTGQLAQALPQGRCAVMKHLGVLQTAGLVTVHRRGRERWNHLNVAPLQQIHEHWVRPYEALWAAPLLHLRRVLEQATPSTETARVTDAPLPTLLPEQQTAVAGMLTVHLEIDIRATRERVWRALTEQVDLWWPRDFLASGNPQGMRFEASLGGKLVEESVGGGGIVWYTVYGLTPGQSIDMVGHLSPAFGGPAQSLLRLELSERDGATILALTDAVAGNVGPKTAVTNEAGWRAIFETSFKRFVEEH